MENKTAEQSKQSIWKRENRWKLRCRIYGWFMFPHNALSIILNIFEFILELYRKFLIWIFWTALDFMFRSVKGKKNKDAWKELFENGTE